MGHVRVPVQIANASRRELSVTVSDALVDTGATWAMIPRRIADKLELPVLDRVPTTTAAGPATMDHSYALLEYNGRTSAADILISDTYDGVLIGVVTLEGLRLAVDPVSRRLVDADLLAL